MSKHAAKHPASTHSCSCRDRPTKASLFLQAVQDLPNEEDPLWDPIEALLPGLGGGDFELGEVRGLSGRLAVTPNCLCSWKGSLPRSSCKVERLIGVAQVLLEGVGLPGQRSKRLAPA